MTITTASFRIDFPEFTSDVLYPDSVLNYWLNLGGLLLNADAWGISAATATNPPTALFDIGLELFAAHNIVLEKQAANAAATGGDPGLNTGPVASKAVGPVNISYDTQAGIAADAGHWNLTTYGTRFIKLARMMGMGPVQVNIGSCYGGYGNAYAGPIVDTGFGFD